MMTLDNPSAVVSTVVHATVAGVGAIFCVVVEQPYWLPIVCSIVAALPSGIRLWQDRRLKEATAEAERQKRRAEAAEAKLASVNVDGAEKAKETK